MRYIELQKLWFSRSFFEVGALSHFIRSEQWLVNPLVHPCPFCVQFITEHCYIYKPSSGCVSMCVCVCVCTLPYLPT